MPELAVLQERIAVLQRVVVAFSGGADSAFLAWVANDVLGPDRAVAVTAVSPSLAGDELDDCRALAAEWELRWQTVVTDEVDDPAYAANDGLRCFHCKSALMDAVAPLAAAARATVVLGVNCDDLGDHRPGQQAAAARGAVFPMVEAGFTKADVRDWSRRLGLRTWDKPAAACLSSRVPYGTPVTVAVLGRVERAEAALRRLGFGELRVRHYDDVAAAWRCPSTVCPRSSSRREAVVAAVRAAGYRYVTPSIWKDCGPGTSTRC